MLTTMITTCPACTTVFRINDAQLAARDGKVRCGRCSAVFDARAALQSEPATSALESGSSAQSTHPHAEAFVFPEIERIPDAQTALAPTFDPMPEPAPAPTIDPTPEPTPEPAPELTPELTPEPTRAPRIDPMPESAPVDGGPREPRAGPPKKPAVARRASAPGARAAPPARRAPRRAAWAAWAALSVLLVLALTAQLAYHYRAELVLVFPETRPLIEQACVALDCRVPLPRHAELISIESSDLQADPANPNAMVLIATLRNRAMYAQAHPSLELTLTDAQDRPLARRVLGVSEYLGPAVRGDSGFMANSELSVRVHIEASSLSPTGYRLYLFYP